MREWIREETEIEDKFKVYIDTLESQKLIIEQLKNKIERYEQYAKIRIEKGEQKEQQRVKPRYFVKTYKAPAFKIRRSKILTYAEKALLFDAYPYANYETNIIVNGDGTPMRIEQIAELCDRNRTYATELLSSLESKGIVEKIKDKQRTYIKLNKNYFECG